MSNLGLMILYRALNDMPGVLAERAYLPWVDMINALRQAEIPLYSLENKRPLSDFDIIGVTLPYEQVYTNTLEMLHLGGIPPRSEERDESHPLIVAGGHATFNPEPMSTSSMPSSLATATRPSSSWWRRTRSDLTSHGRRS